MSEFRVTPDKYLPFRYAGASGDFNPIHLDPDLAKAVGFPGNILHGLWSMAQVARAALDAGEGDPRKLKRLAVEFRGIGLPEQEIVVTATEKGDADGPLLLDLIARQDGRAIIKNAEAELER
jgi:acyl dehydratase